MDIVFVFLDGGTKNLYQLQQWVQPLKRMSIHFDISVLCKTEFAEAIAQAAGLPVTRIEDTGQVTEFFATSRPKVLLYPNQNVKNFYPLRYRSGVHVWVSHGESDKAYMYQHTLKRFDLYFAAGRAAVERVQSHVNGYRADRIRLIGRPQVHDRFDVPAEFKRHPETKGVVFYAPTWEGVTRATRYSSIASHGLALVKALTTAGFQVVYRPHPLSGSRDEPISKANQNIKDFLLSESKRTGVAHLIDASVFGWQLAELDLMITDVSAVAYDWLVTSKPLIITKPADSNALINDAPIFGSLDLLPVDESSAIAQRIEREKQQLAQGGSALKDLREYYFGAAQDFDQQLATALQSALDLHAAELGGQALTEAEPFSSRGAKLGWLRYPNFVLRIGFKLLGKWVGASRRKPKAHTEVLYSHLSDPFNFKSVKPTLDLLWQEAAKSDGSSPLVLATNQISTYLYLHAGFWWRSRKHKLARRLLVIPSISTADAEATLAATAASEVRHLKHHPFNTMLIRSNSASHVLWLPESDPLFDAGHCVTMYDRVVTSSDAVCEVVDQLVSVARPELQKLP